jgi:PTH1 family peptidyl-tRNA hydrolase
MHLIVGLGNPGDQYKNTRHNVGFDIIDLVAEKYNISVNRVKFKGVYGELNIRGEKVILLKPQTYMNLSGESVKEISDFFKIQTKNIIVIYDDISLDIGKLRIRSKGSAGGHNGIKSIIAQLSTDEFPRIKVGVGQPKHDLVNHVLGRFDKVEREKVEKVFVAAVNTAECILEHSVEEAMNKFNGFVAE